MITPPSSYLHDSQNQKEFLEGHYKQAVAPNIDIALMNVTQARKEARKEALKAERISPSKENILRFVTSHLWALYYALKDLFSAPAESWLPTKEVFDSWATRFGALGVIQVLVNQVREDDPNAISPFSAFTSIGVAFLLVAASLPLWRYVQELSKAVSDIVLFRSIFVPVILVILSFAVLFPSVGSAINLLMSPQGMVIVSASIIAITVILLLVAYLMRRKIP